MRFIKPALTAIITLGLFFSTPSQAAEISKTEPVVNPINHIPTYTEEELRLRIKQMTSAVVPPRFTSVVKGYIDTYTIKRRDKTEAMLGRRMIYFPMFEKYLAEHGLPQDLKYLSIVESALNPDALSRSGAAGLWQFMPPTGRSQGLKISSYVDERKDPHKSTEAALRYLAKQYKRFGSWELALAAYNGGPGRVSRAIKRGRSKNFWRITRYLPRETRNYVPAFIAATYIGHYHHLHGLYPTTPGHMMVNTAMAKVYDEVSFAQLSEITGTPYHIVAALNPSYKRSVILRSSSGNNLVLPKAAMAAYLNHVGRPDHKLNQLVAQYISAPNNSMETAEKAVTSHQVKPEENIEGLAHKYNCSIDEIKHWNKLTGNNIRPGQYLMLFLDKYPTKLIPYQPMVGVPTLACYANCNCSELATVKTAPIPQIKMSGKFSNTKAKGQGNYVYHKMKRRESLKDVARKYKNVTLESIMELNNFNHQSRIKPGMKIKIRKK